jgi:hypothetical protein
MNRRIPFSFLVGNGIMLQKYPITIALKSLFEEILAKRENRPSCFFNRGMLAVGASRR